MDWIHLNGISANKAVKGTTGIEQHNVGGSVEVIGLNIDGNFIQTYKRVY